MKNSEEAIDKLLTGLRATEPPAGMNQRIMAGLHNQSAALTHTTPRYVRVAWLSVPAVAALLVSALIFHAARHQAHVPTQPAQPSAKEAPSKPQPPVRAQTAPPLAHLTRTSRAIMRSASRPGSKVSIGAAQDTDALAEEEMRAASQPAPPLPLSNQEKLLLRMTHKRTPIELAALSPATRARHDAEEEADFQKFFEPPKPTVDNE